MLFFSHWLKDGNIKVNDSFDSRVCNLVIVKADPVGRRWEGKEGECVRANIVH